MTEKERELLNLAWAVSVNYDGQDTVEGLQNLMDEVNEMVDAVLKGESEEYLDSLE